MSVRFEGSVRVLLHNWHFLLLLFQLLLLLRRVREQHHAPRGVTCRSVAFVAPMGRCGLSTSKGLRMCPAAHYLYTGMMLAAYYSPGDTSD